MDCGLPPKSRVRGRGPHGRSLYLNRCSRRWLQLIIEVKKLQKDYGDQKRSWNAVVGSTKKTKKHYFVLLHFILGDQLVKHCFGHGLVSDGWVQPWSFFISQTPCFKPTTIWLTKVRFALLPLRKKDLGLIPGAYMGSLQLPGVWCWSLCQPCDRPLACPVVLPGQWCR